MCWAVKFCRSENLRNVFSSGNLAGLARVDHSLAFVPYGWLAVLLSSIQTFFCMRKTCCRARKQSWVGEGEKRTIDCEQLWKVKHDAWDDDGDDGLEGEKRPVAGRKFWRSVCLLGLQTVWLRTRVMAAPRMTHDDVTFGNFWFAFWLVGNEVQLVTFQLQRMQVCNYNCG